MKNHWRMLANILPASVERKVYNNFFQKEHALWEANGRAFPPSHLLKQKALQNLAQKHNVHILVETGTFMGDMVYAMLPYFETIYSIELSELYYQKAIKRFKHSSKIRLVRGDSAEKLNEIVKELKQPALFWLDGHYSGGNTALGAKECPVFEELKAIFTSPLNHVIVIDDARLFVGKNDYPTVAELTTYIKEAWPDAVINIENDSIRLVKSNN